MFTVEEGKTLVRYARDSVQSYLSGKRLDEKNFSFANEKQGVFVTLLTYPAKELRGCIGFPEPVLPLSLAVSKAAISAAVEDPRFPKLSSDELDKVVIEISVLTVPEKIVLGKDGMYEDKITVGKDGLIMRRGYYSGLLLPQVPVEWGWDKKQFLMHACQKAGLPDDAYLSDDIEVYKFQAQIFCEKRPSGDVAEKTIS